MRQIILYQAMLDRLKVASNPLVTIPATENDLVLFCFWGGGGGSLPLEESLGTN